MAKEILCGFGVDVDASNDFLVIDGGTLTRETHCE